MNPRPFNPAATLKSCHVGTTSRVHQLSQHLCSNIVLRPLRSGLQSKIWCFPSWFPNNCYFPVFPRSRSSTFEGWRLQTLQNCISEHSNLLSVKANLYAILRAFKDTALVSSPTTPNFIFTHVKLRPSLLLLSHCFYSFKEKTVLRLLYVHT